MSFYGSSFIFNGVQSEIYDLRLFEFEPANPAEAPGGGDAVISEQWLYRREAPYFYGRYYESSLEFDFTVGSFSPIDGATRHAISRWLVGKSTYLPLRIVQDDIEDVVFNVIITLSPRLYVGNLNYALTLHAKCDRPWGLYYPPQLIKNYAGTIVNERFNYLNNSAYDGYNKPLITFTMNATPTYFSLTNISDSSRVFRFDSLTPYETLTVDNDKGIITSSTGALRMANFNKNFFRLLQGTNTIDIAGNISLFTMEAAFAKGIGG